MIPFLYDWQTLLGAFIGATSALAIWGIAELHKSSTERSERLFFLIKAVGIGAAIAADTQKVVQDFKKDKLQKLIEEASRHVSSPTYFVGTAFFPLLTFTPLDVDFLKLGTGSGYVDAKLIFFVKRSRDLSDTMEDIKRQFEATLNGNRELALLQKNPAPVQNTQFVTDLKNFSDVLQEQILDNNLSVYMKEIIELQVSLAELQRIPLFLWKLRSGPSFKFFRDKHALDAYVACAHERIQNSLKPKFEKRLELINTAFNPPLKISFK